MTTKNHQTSHFKSTLTLTLTFTTFHSLYEKKHVFLFEMKWSRSFFLLSHAMVEFQFHLHLNQTNERDNKKKGQFPAEHAFLKTSPRPISKFSLDEWSQSKTFSSMDANNATTRPLWHNQSHFTHFSLNSPIRLKKTSTLPFPTVSAYYEPYPMPTGLEFQV